MTDVRDHRLEAVERDMGEIKQAIQGIAGSLQTLARLEERHQETRDSLSRAFGQIEDHEQRIRHIERDIPVTKLVRNWVIAAMTGLCGLVLMLMAGKL